MSFKNRSGSHCTIFIMIPFDVKRQNLQMSFTHFCASSYCFRDIKIGNFLPSKSRSRSLCRIFAVTPIDDKCQNLQMSSTHFCTSSYCFRDIQNKTFLASKSISRSQCNFCNDSIRWQLSKSTNVSHIFLN